MTGQRAVSERGTTAFSVDRAIKFLSAPSKYGNRGSFSFVSRSEPGFVENANHKQKDQAGGQQENAELEFPSIGHTSLLVRRSPGLGPSKTPRAVP